MSNINESSRETTEEGSKHTKPSANFGKVSGYQKGSGYQKNNSNYYKGSGYIKGSGYTKGSAYSRGVSIKVTSFIDADEMSDEEEMDEDESKYNLCESYLALIVISLVLVFNTWSRTLLSQLYAYKDSDHPKPESYSQVVGIS